MDVCVRCQISVGIGEAGDLASASMRLILRRIDVEMHSQQGAEKSRVEIDEGPD